MPFTLAHPAAALPFRRLGFVWSALIVGTIAPDLEYFIRLSPGGGYGHSLKGAFLLSLPLALLTLWLFHAFVKSSVSELLPEKIAARMVNPQKFQFGGAGRFSLIVISILFGIATHLLWDSFTHSNRFFYRHWAVLREAFRVPILGIMPVYKILQYGSSVLGVTALVVWLLVWYCKADASARSPVRSGIGPIRKLCIVAAMSLIATLAAASRVFVATGMPLPRSAAKVALILFVVTFISALWWELVLYGFWQSR